MKTLHKGFAALVLLTAAAVGRRWFPETHGPIAAETAADGAQAKDGMEGGRGHGQEGDRLTKALDLSNEQSEQVKAIFLKHRDATAPLRGEMVSERRELRKLIQSDKLDEAAIRSR